MSDEAVSDQVGLKLDDEDIGTMLRGAAPHIGELWSSLTDAEQQQLVDIAQRMASEDIDYGNT